MISVIQPKVGVFPQIPALCTEFGTDRLHEYIIYNVVQSVGDGDNIPFGVVDSLNDWAKHWLVEHPFFKAVSITLDSIEIEKSVKWHRFIGVFKIISTLPEHEFLQMNQYHEELHLQELCPCL